MCNPTMRKNKKGRPKSTRIQTNMNERERGKLKCCSVYRLVGHSKNRCLHHPENSSQSICFPFFCLLFMLSMYFIALYKLEKISSTRVFLTIFL